jgi:hypothetical protein
VVTRILKKLENEGRISQNAEGIKIIWWWLRSLLSRFTFLIFLY